MCAGTFQVEAKFPSNYYDVCLKENRRCSYLGDERSLWRFMILRSAVKSLHMWLLWAPVVLSCLPFIAGSVYNKRLHGTVRCLYHYWMVLYVARVIMRIFININSVIMRIIIIRLVIMRIVIMAHNMKIVMILCTCATCADGRWWAWSPRRWSGSRWRSAHSGGKGPETKGKDLF